MKIVEIVSDETSNPQVLTQLNRAISLHPCLTVGIYPALGSSLGGVYMKPIRVTTRASALAWASFHPHFSILRGSLSGGGGGGAANSGNRADIFTSIITSFCCRLKSVMSNALAPKCLALLLGLALFVVFI